MQTNGVYSHYNHESVFGAAAKAECAERVTFWVIEPLPLTRHAWNICVGTTCWAWLLPAIKKETVIITS